MTTSFLFFLSWFFLSFSLWARPFYFEWRHSEKMFPENFFYHSEKYKTTSLSFPVFHEDLSFLFLISQRHMEQKNLSFLSVSENRASFELGVFYRSVLDIFEPNKALVIKFGLSGGLIKSLSQIKNNTIYIEPTNPVETHLDSDEWSQSRNGWISRASCSVLLPFWDFFQIGPNFEGIWQTLEPSSFTFTSGLSIFIHT
jgi:hypothetical protein